MACRPLLCAGAGTRDIFVNYLDARTVGCYHQGMTNTAPQPEAPKTDLELLDLGPEGRREHLARHLLGRLDLDYADRLTAWVAVDQGISYDAAHEQALSDMDALR